MKKVFSFLALFSSLSTLLCCALPAVLVAVGFGATFSQFLSVFPQVIWVSENKGVLFSLAALSLALAGCFQWQAQFRPCPLDPALREACLWSRHWGLRIYLVSLFIFFIGFLFAFLLA